MCEQGEIYYVKQQCCGKPPTRTTTWIVTEIMITTPVCVQWIGNIPMQMEAFQSQVAIRDGNHVSIR